MSLETDFALVVPSNGEILVPKGQNALVATHTEPQAETSAQQSSHKDRDRYVHFLALP